MATTDDGGMNWTVSQTFEELALTGFGCSTMSQCYISGLIAGIDTPTYYVYSTSDAGVSWSESIGNVQEGQSCPTTDECTVMDYPGGGPPLTSIGEGGSEVVSNASPSELTGLNSLESGVSCPTVLVCYMVDDSAGIYSRNLPAPPVVTTQPISQYYTSGQSLTFTAAASGTPAPTVQWQYSFNGGSTWANLSGATSTTLTVGPLNGFVNNWEVRAVFTNSVNSATSNAATMTLAATAPVVTTQPTSQSYTSGQSLTFTAAASGTPAPTVQWQYSFNGGSTWADLSGATYSLLTLGPLNGFVNNWEVRAVFTNSVNSATSNAATMTLATAPVTLAVTGADVYPLLMAGGGLIVGGSVLLGAATLRRYKKMTSTALHARR
jgi:hypothetical protein